MILLVFLIYGFFASVFIIEKNTLNYSEPFFLIGSRMFIAGCLLLIYQFSFRTLKVNKRIVIKLILFAIINVYLTNIFELLALSKMASYKVSFYYNMSPFVSALFSYFIFLEKLSWKKLLALVIGFVGFIPMIIDKSYKEANVNFTNYGSEFMMLLSLICSVVGWIILKQLVYVENCSAMFANGISMFIGGGMALLHSFFIETWNPVPVSEWIPFLENSFILLILSNIVCYNLYGILLKKYTVTFLSFAGFSTPLFTALLGWFFLGETVSSVLYISASIVCLGLFLFTQAELEEYKDLSLLNMKSAS